VVVFDGGLPCATLVSVTALAHSRSRKPNLGNVLSAWLWKWRMPTAFIVVICTKKSVLFYLYVYFNFIRKFTEQCTFIWKFFFNVLWLLNINISVQLHFLNVHRSPWLCATGLLVIPINTAAMSHTCLWRYLQVCCLMDLQSIFPLPDMSTNFTATFTIYFP